MGILSDFGTIKCGLGFPVLPYFSSLKSQLTVAIFSEIHSFVFEILYLCM